MSDTRLLVAGLMAAIYKVPRVPGESIPTVKVPGEPWRSPRELARAGRLARRGRTLAQIMGGR